MKKLPKQTNILDLKFKQSVRRCLQEVSTGEGLSGVGVGECLGKDM